MKVTIKDVAKEAEVAPSTVSRVLSDNPKISDETKLRVQKAIKKLKYRPNAIARSLANSKTRTLGVVLDSEAEDLFANPFFMQAMKGMSICAQSMGYYIMYAFSKKGDEEFESLTDFCTSGLVDGIVLLRVVEDDKIVNFLKERDFPFVVIGRPDDEKNSMWVDNDNFSATYDVVHKLIEKGHREIGFIGGKGQMNVSKYRLKGYKAALRDADIPIDNDIICEMNNFDEEQGYIAIKQILSKRKVTAIVASDDLLAFGVNKGLKEEGVEDVALVGFNNIPLGEFQNPPLSSIDINADDLGYYAAKLLIDKLEGETLTKMNHIVSTNFIERESFK